MKTLSLVKCWVMIQKAQVTSDQYEIEIDHTKFDTWKNTINTQRRND